MQSATDSNSKEPDTAVITDELKSLDLEKNDQPQADPSPDLGPEPILPNTLSVTVTAEAGNEDSGENPWAEKVSLEPIEKRELKTPDPASLTVSRAWTPEPTVEEKINEKSREDVLKEFDPLAER